MWEAYSDAARERSGWLWDDGAAVELAALSSGSTLSVPLEGLRGRAVLIVTSDPLPAALALIEIDGIARRLVLCPPDLDPRHLRHVIETAEVDVVCTDHVDAVIGLGGAERIVHCAGATHAANVDRTSEHETEWILFTSGTTGVPKMVVHTRATLTGAIAPTGLLAGPMTWATFSDVRRYGGLQVLLRAVLGGGSLVLAARGEGAESFLSRARQRGATHITGTPSHWRRGLMGSLPRDVAPSYVRLSGEIADQSIIDHLKAAFPRARVAHAFASTEAGVAFEVTDGRAGFPGALLGQSAGGVDLRIQDDTLRIRSPRTATRYLGRTSESLLDAEGFVDTGDVVEQRGDRCYFVGRRGGIINVGGLKVHPEEIEAVINRHPGVRMSRVTSRRNPITGAIVAADVVLASRGDAPLDSSALQRAKAEILASCRSALAPHKVPALLSVVDALDVAASGKIVRRDA